MSSLMRHALEARTSRSTDRGGRQLRLRRTAANVSNAIVLESGRDNEMETNVYLWEEFQVDTVCHPKCATLKTSLFRLPG